MTKLYKSNDGKLLEIMQSHRTYDSGSRQTVCVSAVLSYFGITPDMYRYTSSVKNRKAYENVLRKFGWSVRSRKSVFKKATTMGKLKKAISEYKDYTDTVCYMVLVHGHLLLMDANGKTIVDTDPRKIDKRNVYDVNAIFK